ncbi:MAG: DUF4249 domain-containing protein [Bacteroidota bacterium]
MRIAIKILILTIGLFLTSCEDVIDVDLDTAAPRLVIDASIDWERNTIGNEQKIKLSTTTGYYSNEFPTVSGATITVSNSTGNIFNFIEMSIAGEYICTDFIPAIGETYTLTINLNGEIYTAVETLIETANIEDNIVQSNSGGMTGDEIEITYYYQDNANEENYYLHRIITPHVAFPEFRTGNDEFSQGNLISESYSNEDLNIGDNVNLRLYGISKRYFDYFNKLMMASGNDSSPFPTTPTAVRGNIINQTNSKNFAFGYFRLSEVTTKDYTIQ